MFALSIAKGNIGTIRFIRHICKDQSSKECFLPSRGLRDLVRTHRTLNTTSCSHRVAFVWPSGKRYDEKLHLSAIVCGSAAIVYGSAAIVCGSATVVWPSVGIVFASAIDWLLTKFGATFARKSKFHIRVSHQIRDSVTPALLWMWTTKIYMEVKNDVSSLFTWRHLLFVLSPLVTVVT